MSINDEFSALKRRVVTKAKNFKANFLNFKGAIKNQTHGGYGNPLKSGEQYLKESSTVRDSTRESTNFPDITVRASSPKKLKHIIPTDEFASGGPPKNLYNPYGEELRMSQIEAFRLSTSRQQTANQKNGLSDVSTNANFRRTVGGCSSLENNKGATPGKIQSVFGRTGLNHAPIYSPPNDYENDDPYTYPIFHQNQPQIYIDEEMI